MTFPWRARPVAGCLIRLALAIFLALPVLASAQTLQGRVVEHDDPERPVSGAQITLLEPGGPALRAALADTAGRFWLWHGAAGDYRLRVERIGYATVSDHPIRLVADSVVEVEIALRPEAVAVDPIRVVARREVRRFTVDEFYDRMGRMADRGTFLTRAEIEATGAALPSDAIGWAPGTLVRPAGRSGFTNTIRLLSYGRPCPPDVYLDGRPLPAWAELDEEVMVGRIEGIEIYRGQLTPDTYPRSAGNRACGAILVWTRPEPDPRFAPTWGRTLLFAALGALVLGASLLF